MKFKNVKVVRITPELTSQQNIPYYIILNLMDEDLLHIIIRPRWQSSFIIFLRPERSEGLPFFIEVLAEG